MKGISMIKRHLSFFIGFIFFKTGFLMKKSCNNIIFFKTVKMFLDPPRIHWFCRSDRHPCIAEFPCFFQLHRVYAVQ